MKNGSLTDKIKTTHKLFLMAVMIIETEMAVRLAQL